MEELKIMLKKEDAKLIKHYAQRNNQLISDYVLESVLKRVEDDYFSKQYKAIVSQSVDDEDFISGNGEFSNLGFNNDDLTFFLDEEEPSTDFFQDEQDFLD